MLPKIMNLSSGWVSSEMLQIPDVIKMNSVKHVSSQYEWLGICHGPRGKACQVCEIRACWHQPLLLDANCIHSSCKLKSITSQQVIGRKTLLCLKIRHYGVKIESTDTVFVLLSVHERMYGASISACILFSVLENKKAYRVYCVMHDV